MSVLGPLRNLAKQGALLSLGSEFAVRLKISRIAASGRLTILNLHRVAPDDRSSYPPLDPSLFDDLLRFAKRHFEILTFGDLAAPPDGARPQMILSFDDGYRDFAEVAAPLLAKHGVRANLNIIPACIDSGQPPLNVIVQDFVGRAPAALVERLEVPGFTGAGPLRSRIALGNRLSAFLKNKPIAEQKQLAPVLREQMLRDADFAPTPMMSLDQLREVAQAHEIGGHSFEHANMAMESDDYLRADVARCANWLARTLGQGMDVYAFPNGSYRPGQIDIVRAAGVRHILLVDEDFSDGAATLHPRFTFDAHSLSEVRFRAAGAFKRAGRRQA